MMIFLKNRDMAAVLLTVTLGIMPQLFFKNGFLLSYLSSMDLASSSIMVLLALPSAIMFFLSIPFAYFSDKYGKKKIGRLGNIMTVAGFTILFLSGFFDMAAVKALVTSGIVIFSIGLTAIVSSWFALLQPVVPENIRGSFFGTLRVTWQIFAIFCSVVITWILERHTSLYSYQLIVGFFTVLMAFQFFAYSAIPELEESEPNIKPVREIITGILDLPGYMPFCAYCFLLMLATGAWPVTLGFLEKDVLNFSDDQIVHMGTLLFLGSMAGFYLGGKLVDRFGTRIVFLTVHFSFFIFLFMVLLRDLFPVEHTIGIGITIFGLGLVQSASSIAITSEMMALAHGEHKSVTLSFCNALMLGGAAISGVVSGKIIEVGIFSEHWTMMGLSLTNYDTLILIYSMMVFVFTVTLGLIPSVIKTRKAQWVPHSTKTV